MSARTLERTAGDPPVAAIRSVGVMANGEKAEALDIARLAASYLTARDIRVSLQAGVAAALGQSHLACDDDQVARADAVLVLGGDGTILATSRRCAPLGTPMLPIHLGRFGFLTEVAPADFLLALERLLAGNYRVDERMMLRGTSTRNREPLGQTTAYALNDIVLANGPLSRVLHLRLSIDGEFVTSYAADGIIIATPTGSTAYSLSAGGPIVHPGVDTILVTPICPHTLTARALLIPCDAVVTVVVEHDPQDIVRVTVDGQQGFPMGPGDEIRVCRSPYPARLLSVGGPNFYDKLQTKLRWGER